MADVDFYALLGIPRDADAKAIKRAYHRKAGQCHPDIAGEAGKDAFQLVTRAYNILSDPEKREAYDVGYQPVASIADLYRRHREGKKVMEIMLPTAPAAKQIGLDLFMTVTVPSKLLESGGSITITLPGNEAGEMVLQLPPNATKRTWCRLPYHGSPGRNGADSGDLWIQLIPQEEA